MPTAIDISSVLGLVGAFALSLIAFVVLTSYFRRVFGHHRWKQLH